MTNEQGSEVTFEILEHIGVLATFSTGWRKEVNLVSWNGAAAKYDIREWSPNYEMMSRGITFKENEMRLLLEVMKRRRNFGRVTDDRPGPVKIKRQPDDVGSGAAGKPEKEDESGYQQAGEADMAKSADKDDVPF